MFFTLNVDILHDATYLAAAGVRTCGNCPRQRVRQDLLNSYAYQPELVMNYPSNWIYPPNSTPEQTSLPSFAQAVAILSSLGLWMHR